MESDYYFKNWSDLIKNFPKMISDVFYEKWRNLTFTGLFLLQFRKDQQRGSFKDIDELCMTEKGWAIVN